MLVSLEWLSDFVEVPPLSELVDALVRAGIEVEQVFEPAGAVEGVVVGEVLSAEPHPKADRLKICQVTDGATRFAVVCGAANVAAGQRVAFAKIGATLPGFTITRRNIRGTDSEGMICSQAELGLVAKSDGIWVLPADAALGKPIFEVMPSGAKLELSIGPNRPDLLSHFGVAREIAAAFGTKMKIPLWRASEKGAPAATLARVLVEDSKACRRFVARVLTNVKVGPSPEWLRERLEAVGQRSINNVVDATNYVMLELGQPLHAYDLSKLAAESGLPTLRVRRAAADEVLVTLDGVERRLDADDLLICDAVQPVGLAGVMGGAGSEVSDATNAVLLEGAFFEAVSVRRAAKRHGLHTEAARRFERGADIGITQRAVERCAQILSEMGACDVGKGIIEVAPKNDAAREITLRLPRVPRVLGLDLPAETVVKLLEPLEIRCTARNESSLRFQAPTFRPDLTREIDLMEEIARRHGYDAVPERTPDAGGPYRYEPATSSRRDVARGALLALGCSEVVTYGFGPPAHYALFAGREGEPARLINPLGEELSTLRSSLQPGLLGVVSRNQRQGAHDLRFFEVGTTFRRRTTPVAATPSEHERSPAEQAVLAARDVDLLDERLYVGVALAGGRHEGRWYEGDEKVDFADLAGVLERLVEAFDPSGRLAVIPAQVDGLHPHCGAELRLGDIVLGVAGQLHPDRARTFDVQGTVFVAEVSLDALAAAPRRRIVHQPLPKFPGTRRDLAVIAPTSVAAEQLRGFIEANAGGALGQGVVERVRLFDVYRGKPIPDTHVSLAFAIEYRSRERTLTDAEVNSAFEAVMAQVKSTFGVEIRQ